MRGFHANVVLSAWHTGTGAIRAMTTPVRAVCANTVRAALERAQAVQRVRHVGDPTGQLHEARRVLGLTVDYYRQFAVFGDQLALAPMSERRLGDILAELYPDNAALGGSPSRAHARARSDSRSVSLTATPSATPRSKWCAWNAIVEFHDHHGRPRTPEGGFVRKLEDPTASSTARSTSWSPRKRVGHRALRAHPAVSAARARGWPRRTAEQAARR
ncbi:MAG: hypothetical protein V7607_2513 [Solirubrobacteraceae bacterium]